MAFTKATMIIQLATNVSDPAAVARRLGGWSESWYDNSHIGTVVRDFRKLCEARAKLLPSGASIVGQRYQEVDPVGPSQTDAKVYGGTAGQAADIPQMSLLCKIRGDGVRNIRPLALRGIPDGLVVEGEYKPIETFKRDLDAFFAETEAWYFRGRDFTVAPKFISSTLANGTIYTEAAHGFSANDVVQISRTLDNAGNYHGGKFQIDTVLSPAAFTVRGWDGSATKGGTVFKKTFAWIRIPKGACSVSRIITKKVGRPFTQYRGRRSASR